MVESIIISYFCPVSPLRDSDGLARPSSRNRPFPVAGRGLTEVELEVMKMRNQMKKVFAGLALFAATISVSSCATRESAINNLQSPARLHRGRTAAHRETRRRLRPLHGAGSKGRCDGPRAGHRQRDTGYPGCHRHQAVNLSDGSFPQRVRMRLTGQVHAASCRQELIHPTAYFVPGRRDSRSQPVGNPAPGPWEHPSRSVGAFCLCSGSDSQRPQAGRKPFTPAQKTEWTYSSEGMS